VFSDVARHQATPIRKNPIVVAQHHFVMCKYPFNLLQVPIERDTGCAQMMCKRCKHVFCWYCLQSLDVSYHSTSEVSERSERT
jgi:hypothetical protein